MLTELEYNNARTEFNNGNHNIDYAVRNLTVLDDEQTRLIEDFETLPRDVWRRLWRPNLNTAEIEHIEALLDFRPNTPWEASICEILMPYISNRELYAVWPPTYDNDLTWEHVFFADTYAEYVELESDS